MQTLDLEPGGGPGPADPPSSPVRLLAYSVAVALALVTGSLVMGDDTGTRRGGRVPRPAPVAPTTPVDVVPVRLREVCPVTTDHRDYLTVSFRLANTDDATLHVTAVTGPPLGGLRQDRPATGGGTCEKPGRGPARARLVADGTRLWTVRWKLPDTCPESSPLRIGVSYRRPGDVTPDSGPLVVLPDLTGIGFVQCPKVVTAFPEQSG
ncbi:hypothetical protein KIH74_12185 [Kineosporia sp. J2-2]|uniref:Secreted protein n=1 Tax=Kineosporia corallincola TaxID=2835133 RepID=A0ABS5TF26_9ACTN|nr:hypothetical protein [Kineosporia corallincola]MBT0769687.1 hypothetical protein [Kineosporia corallincola]